MMNLNRQARSTTLCQKKWDKSVAQETPASLKKNNRGKYNTEAYVITISLIAHHQTMPQW